MADVRAFNGIHYNETLLKDLSALICPPYDVISPEQQEALYKRSEYNFIRLEHSRELPQDTDKDNKYTRASAFLEKWLAERVLVQDDKPTIYLHDHYFSYMGVNYRRRGIFTRVRLEEWDKMIIRPHEGTLTAPRGDRLNLARALKANTSPILALYDDPDCRIAAVLEAAEKTEPLASSQEADGERHVLRAINDPEAVKIISDSLAGGSLYIADGHHRYESALTYRQERQKADPSPSPEAEYNFAMMMLIDIADPGLLVLPPHRLMRGISRDTLNGMEAELGAFFDIEKLPLSEPGVWDRVDALVAEKGRLRITLYGLDTENLFMLTLRNPMLIDHMMPHFHSDIYRSLDVSVVDHVILENLLAHSHDIDAANLGYCYDRYDSVKRVQNQEFQLTLLISPATPALIKAVADIGDKMPRKSTYFYPKTPSGLVFHRLK